MSAEVKNTSNFLIGEVNDALEKLTSRDRSCVCIGLKNENWDKEACNTLIKIRYENGCAYRQCRVAPVSGVKFDMRCWMHKDPDNRGTRAFKDNNSAFPCGDKAADGKDIDMEKYQDVTVATLKMNKDNLMNLGNKVQDLLSHYAAIEIKWHNATTKLKFATEEIGNLRKEMATLKVERDKLKGELKTANATIANLEKKIADLDEKLRLKTGELSAKIVACDENDKKCQDDILELNAQIENLTEANNDLIVNLENIKNERNQLLTSKEAISSELVDAKKNITILDTTNEQLRAEKDILDTEKSRVKKTLASAEQATLSASAGVPDESFLASMNLPCLNWAKKGEFLLAGWQEKVYKRIRDANSNRFKIIAPTGSGKTYLAIMIMLCSAFQKDINEAIIVGSSDASLDSVAKLYNNILTTMINNESLNGKITYKTFGIKSDTDNAKPGIPQLTSELKDNDNHKKAKYHIELNVPLIENKTQLPLVIKVINYKTDARYVNDNIFNSDAKRIIILDEFHTRRNKNNEELINTYKGKNGIEASLVASNSNILAFTATPIRVNGDKKLNFVSFASDTKYCDSLKLFQDQTSDEKNFTQFNYNTTIDNTDIVAKVRLTDGKATDEYYKSIYDSLDNKGNILARVESEVTDITGNVSVPSNAIIKIPNIRYKQLVADNGKSFVVAEVNSYDTYDAPSSYTATVDFIKTGNSVSRKLQFAGRIRRVPTAVLKKTMNLVHYVTQYKSDAKTTLGDIVCEASN